MGSEEFVNWIRNRFIHSKDNDREIVEIKELKRVDATKIKEVTREKLIGEGKLTDKIKIYLLRKYSEKTLKDIGIEFGNVGISEVSHIVRRLDKQRETDKSLDKKIKAVERIILSNKQA